MTLKNKIKKMLKLGEQLPIPSELEFNTNDHILIVAPHPDDESIGCGGILAKYGPQCDVILLTDGRFGNPEWPCEKTIKIREEEFDKVMEKALVNKCFKMKICDSTLKKNSLPYAAFDFRPYQYIFVPNRYEIHPDHAATFRIVRRNMKRQGGKGYLIEYEVWSALSKATHYIDLSDIIEKKVEFISFYKCQLKHIDYISRIKGLNYYRGINHSIDYAESYYVNYKLHQLLAVKFFETIDNLLFKHMANLKHFIVKHMK